MTISVIIIFLAMTTSVVPDYSKYLNLTPLKKRAFTKLSDKLVLISRSYLDLKILRIDEISQHNMYFQIIHSEKQKVHPGTNRASW